MITDFFSHKIHSSKSEWQDKLVELAQLFAQFDEQPYDRDQIETRLLAVSPRNAYAPRDPSKFRDEISAYQAYLGLYSLHRARGQWFLRLSQSARHYLLREEPDVEAFMRLQLALFQYPNGMGARYVGQRVTVQENASRKTLEIVSNNIHISPMRLVCKALIVDTRIRGCDDLAGQASYAELYALANYAKVNQTTNPPIEAVEEALQFARRGVLPVPGKFERRFHILQHTGMFAVGNSHVRFRQPVCQQDRDDLLSKVRTISNIDAQFVGFDAARTRADIESVVESGEWGHYFDGARTLSGETVARLAYDVIGDIAPVPGTSSVSRTGTRKYSLTARNVGLTPPPAPTNRRADLADPEITKVKRQKRNLAHKQLVEKMEDLLRGLGAMPHDSPHIDLYATIPGDGAFLFEMKSGGENLIDQIRKGLSQLYEYKYRYSGDIAPTTSMCLVLNEDPDICVPWVSDYLCNDRGILLCWFDNNGELQYPRGCASLLGVLGV